MATRRCAANTILAPLRPVPVRVSCLTSGVRGYSASASRAGPDRSRWGSPPASLSSERRGPQVSPRSRCRIRLGDAEYLKGMAVNSESLPDNVRVLCEVILPVLKAEHHDRTAVGYNIVLLYQEPPNRGSYTEHVEV